MTTTAKSAVDDQSGDKSENPKEEEEGPDQPKATPAETTKATAPVASQKSSAAPAKSHRVRFGGNTKQAAPLGDLLSLPEVPRKVRMPFNVWRDVGTPIAFLVFAILFCWGIKDVGTRVSGEKKTRLNLIQDVAEKLAYDQMIKRGGYLAPNCTMYFTKSSIPGAGQSVFAGRDYETGEVVFPAGDFLPVSLDQSNHLFIQQYAFSLKHHHLLANLEGTTFVSKNTLYASETDNHQQDFAARASRPIKAGEELLLPFTLHPKSQMLRGDGTAAELLFKNIPSRDDFYRAAEIIQDEIQRFRRRKRDKVTATAKGKEIEANLNVIYRTAQKLNPNVARFLPLTKPDLDRWIKVAPTTESIGFDSMQNHSVNALAMNAQCLSYATTTDSESGSIVTTTKKMAAGSSVMPVPLLLLSRLGQESCDNVEAETGQCVVQDGERNNNKMLPCLGHIDLPVLLCPLSIASKLTVVDNDDSVDDGKNAPNVELKWNKFISHNKKSQSLSIDEVAKLYTTQLQLDVVALRDLEKGEQLRVKLGPAFDRAFASIPDTLLPDAWRKNEIK